MRDRNANTIPKELRNPADLADVVMILEFELEILNQAQAKTKSLIATIKLQDRILALYRSVKILEDRIAR